MGVYSFQGFFYIENDPYGPIDNSFGYQKDVSNNPAAGRKVTYEDMLAKFASPIVLSRQTALITQKIITDNYAYQDTEDDLDFIDTNIDGWDKLFNIATYIYHKSPSMTAAQMNNVLNGAAIDNDYLSSMFTGYINGTIDIVMRVDDPTQLSKMSFSVMNEAETQTRSVKFWVNPETFINEFITPTPYIYVWYTPDDEIDRSEQAGEITKIYNNIGREFVNRYQIMYAPLYTPDGIMQPFHIFTKAIEIPYNPLEDIVFLNAIRETIRARESSLTEDELVDKYPTIFTEGHRAIWPLFNNKSIKGYRITDPLTGNASYYMSNPLRLTVIQEEIAASPILQGADGVYEVITLAHKWFPFIVFGIGGALSDKIPKYKPLLEDCPDGNQEDAMARLFNIFFTRVLNYILGDNKLSQEDRDSMGFIETTTFASFKLRGIEWRIYKRGYQTPFDLEIAKD
jgi:hypothetical protein